MVIACRQAKLLLITQPEHARLAGVLAERWGGDGFDAPEWRSSYVTAAYRHDDGWGDLDAEPRFNPDAGRPIQFSEIPLDEHVALYKRGVDRVYLDDPYAGILAGMHWTGLYHTRWGFQGSGGGPPLTRRMLDATSEEEHRAVDERRRLWERGPRSEFDAALWHAYAALQAVDLLSLYLCATDGTRLTKRALEPTPAHATIVLGDHGDEPRLLSSVPTRPGAALAQLELNIVAPGVVVIDPYPLGREEREVEVDARVIADRRYESGAVAAVAYRDSPVETIRWRLTGT
jgi:hypothetical protein